VWRWQIKRKSQIEKCVSFESNIDEEEAGEHVERINYHLQKMGERGIGENNRIEGRH